MSLPIRFLTCFIFAACRTSMWIAWVLLAEPVAAQDDFNLRNSLAVAPHQDRHTALGIRPLYQGVEAEVLQNILEQKVGSGRLADYQIDQKFLRKIADRIIRSSFREQFQKVQGVDGPAPTRALPPISSEVDIWLEGFRCYSDPLFFASWQKLGNTRPPLRGFLVGSAIGEGFQWPKDERKQRLASLVQQQLASAGLQAMTVRCIHSIGAASFLAMKAERSLELLGEVGLPVDLLGLWGSNKNPTEWTRWIAAELASGRDAGAVVEELRGVAFLPSPQKENFVVAAEDGSRPVGCIRVQLTRGSSWGGVGDGGALDIFGQLSTALTRMSFVVQVPSYFFPTLRQTLQPIQKSLASRSRFLLQGAELSQWTQDSGKAGAIQEGDGWVNATLVPRYASRREDGSEFVAGDQIGLEVLRRSGHPVIRSQLLFQGGDVLAVRSPNGRERWLLVGEAELYRNTALGLNREQVLALFRHEFGVDQVHLIQHNSFHLDMDVSIRRQGGKSIAFVADREAAVLEILRLGLVSLTLAGFTASEEAEELLKKGAVIPFVQSVAQFTYGQRRGEVFPREFVRHFSYRDREFAAAGNLGRFLTALDIYASSGLTDVHLATAGHATAQLRAHRRWQFQHIEFLKQLQGLGFQRVRVAAFTEAEQTVSPLNAVQLPTKMLVPIHGGYFQSLDTLALNKIASTLKKGSTVLPIRCTESFRRAGALHCSIVVYPFRPQWPVMMKKEN